MKRIHCIVLLLISAAGAVCQKNIVDNNTYKRWERLVEVNNDKSMCLISSNGRYVAYKYDSAEHSDILVVKSLDGKYQKKFYHTSPYASFTNDNKRIVFELKGDSAGILTLGTESINYYPNILSCSMPETGDGKWMAFLLKEPSKSLMVENLTEGIKKKYENVREFKFDDKGNVLILATSVGVTWVDLKKNTETQIWKGETASNLTFNAAFTSVAFNAENEGKTYLYYYTKGKISAISLVNENTPGMNDAGMTLANGFLQFSPDGSKIFFNITIKEPVVLSDIKKYQVPSNLTIWNYLDKYTSSDFYPKDVQERYRLENTVEAVCSVMNPRVIQINPSRTMAWWSRGNKYAIVYNNMNSGELYWNKQTLSFYLVSLDDGSSRLIKDFKNESPLGYAVAPDESYFVWFDSEQKQYFSYDIATSAVVNISKSVNIPLYNNENQVEARRTNYGFAGWTFNKEVLFYDKYDIWKLDLTGKREPVNLTRGYGRENKIILRRACRFDKNYSFVEEKSLLLAGFNTVSKENGFWTLSVDEQKLLKKTMGPYVYWFGSQTPNFLDYLTDYNPPVKAKDARLYVVQRMSTSESVNLFATEDFEHFKRLTDIHPEKKYKWMTSELVKWTMPDGEPIEGLLYKPDDFNPGKKYPIIFHYYERSSDGLNIFPGEPSGELNSGIGLTSGVLSIPWYVSHDYIVFVPNLHTEYRHPAKAIVNSVTSAVKYLSQFSWADTSKLGLQGHSYGGFATMTIIAHTHLFVAAQESQGTVNSINYYGHGEGMRNHYFDKEQGNLGCAPWDCPDIYIENSPLFHVQNITTPLLMMNNKGDKNVPSDQGMALFTAMRKLNKPVWAIDYGIMESHSVGHPVNQLDFSIRQQQFFDHYLKDRPAPMWMNIVNNYSIDIDDPAKMFESEIYPELRKDATWSRILPLIKKQRTGKGEELLVGSSVVYYLNAIADKREKDLKNFMQAARYYATSFPNNLQAMTKNNWAFTVFLNSNDIHDLNTAIGWAKSALVEVPNDHLVIDTYASLLYKLGKKEEAIKWEEKAVQLSDNEKSMVETLEKMKRGDKIWEN